MSFIRTDQVWPTRLESTSNSASSRPSSDLTFSFQTAPLLQVPVRRTSGSLARAAGAAVATRPAARAIAVRVRRVAVVVMVVPFWSGAGVPATA